MTTISKLPEEQVSNYLNDMGLLSPISGLNIAVQLFEFSEPKDPKTPVVCIRPSGVGVGGDNDIRYIPINIFLVSSAQPKMIDYRLRAEEILNATLTTGRYEDIISMQSSGAVSGPYRTSSDRLVFEISVNVLFSN